MPVSPEEIEIRSDEVQEILTAIPNWIVRWGMTVVFVSVVMLVAASFFIKYPDTIDSRIILTTTLPPARMIARSPGNISFFVADKEQVEVGSLLGVIENPATTKDVLALDAQLTPFVKQWRTGSDQLSLNNWSQEWDLGALQPSYLALRNALLTYSRFQDLDIYTQQVAALEERIRFYEDLNVQQQKQNVLFAEELELTKQQFSVDSTLFVRQALSEREYSQSRNTLIQTKRSVESANLQITNNRITISQLRAQIREIQIQEQREASELKAAIDGNLETVESQLLSWKQQFLLTATIPGQVNFSDYWSDNQFVQVNEEVLTIIPDTSQLEENQLLGQVKSPIRNSGKLKLGQRVNIRFDNYPANEYGMVMGEVTNISLVPKKEFYSVQVRLVDGLNTTYKRKLDYRPEMSGSAQIITEDLRLIDRIFNQFRALVDRTTEGN